MAGFMFALIAQLVFLVAYVAFKFVIHRDRRSTDEAIPHHRRPLDY
jgi:hypothetical protein